MSLLGYFNTLPLIFVHIWPVLGFFLIFLFSARSPDTYSMNEEFEDDYDDMDDMGTPPLSDRRRRSAPELPQFHWTLEKVGISEYFGNFKSAIGFMG